MTTSNAPEPKASSAHELPTSVAAPRKRGWFRRAPAVVAISAVCPACKVTGAALLVPGQVCVTCRSQQAWTELASTGLVIDRAAINEAAIRRAGEAAGEPLWNKALVLVPSAVALAAAAAAGWSTTKLMSVRAIGPLNALLADLAWTSKRTFLLGLLAFVLAVVGFVRLRRQRHYRRIPLLASHAIASMVGATALVLGGVQWIFGGGHFGAYTSMPPQVKLSVTASVERILNATVVVLAPGADGDARNLGIGTGAVVAADDHRAWIVTCSHVAMPYVSVGAPRHARDAQPVWIQLADGREGRGTIRWAAPVPLDVVVIELPIDHPPEPVPIAKDASALQAAASVTFVPNPYRSGWKVVHGELLRRETHHTTAGSYDLLFTSLPVTFGDSGSGLFDARGQLVGLNTWTRVGGNGPAEGISLPSETMRALVDAIEGGHLDQLDDTVLERE